MKVKSIRLIWIIIFFMIILTVLGILLYLKTNLFRSKEILLKKYFSQNIEDITHLFDFSKQRENLNELLTKNYTENTSLDISYISSNEKVETFNIKEQGIINNSENTSYRKISCTNNDYDIIDVELLKQNEIYGFRLTNLIKQFVSIENNNLSTLVSSLGYNEKYIEDKLNFSNIDLLNLLEFTDEEINKLKEKYVNLIFEGLNKNNYSSKSNSLITLNNGESVNTKAYTLIVDKNEFDNICKRVISKAIDDELILSKINKIDETIANIGIKNNENFQNRYKNKLQEIYNSLEYKGEDDKKIYITVYVIDDKVLRTFIKTEFIEYYIDKDTKKENAMSLKIIKLTNEGTDNKIFTLANKNNLEFKFENNDNNCFEITLNNQNEENKLNVTSNISYKSDKIPQITILFETQYDFSKNDKSDVEFENDKNIILNKYDKETLQAISDGLENIIIKKLEESNEKTKSNLLKNIIEFLNNKQQEKIDKRKEEFEEKKNSFNNKFLLYEGEKIEYENIKKLLYVVGKNMKKYEITENNKIRIYLEENKENTKKANEILSLLKENDLYNVKMNYLENGMLNSIDLSIYKEKKED